MIEAPIPVDERDRQAAIGRYGIVDTLSESNFDVITALMAWKVEALMELHLQNRRLFCAQQQLLERNKDLRRFAGVVSHDLKTPISNIVMLADALAESPNDALSEEERQDIQQIRQASMSLAGYVDGLLDYYTSENITSNETEIIDVQAMVADIENMTGPQTCFEWCLPKGLTQLKANKAVLVQVLTNLIANASKYNDSEQVQITVHFTEHAENVEVAITDNGRGIPADRLDGLFDLFVTGDDPDRHGQSGTGIGLSVVRKLLTSVGGEVIVQSAPGKGSTFTVFLPGQFCKSGFKAA